MLGKFDFGIHLASVRKDSVILIGMERIIPEGTCFIGEPDVCLVDDRSIISIGRESHVLQADEVEDLCRRN